MSTDMTYSYIPPSKKEVGSTVRAPAKFTVYKSRKYYEGDDVAKKYPLFHLFVFTCETVGVTESCVEYRVVENIGEWFRPQNVSWQVADAPEIDSVGSYVHWSEERSILTGELCVHEYGDFVVKPNND